MRRSLGIAATVMALATLSGCSIFPVACSLEARMYTVIVDAGDAAAIEACVKSVCATSLSEEPRDYSSEGNLYVGRAAHGKFSVGTEFSPAEVITVSVLNADGTPASKPRTFDLEWSPGPNACGWGEASTDPISL